MSQRILFVMPDNSVQISQPAPRGRRDGEDPMAWLKRVADKARPKGAVGDAHIIDIADLPKEHRDAWVWNGGKVVVDPSRIPRPTLDKPPSIVDTGPGRIRVDFDPTPLYEEIETLKQQNVDLADRLTQLIDYVTHVRLIEANKTLAINATKSDAEVPTAEQQKIREAARHYLSISAQKRGMGFDEFVAVAKREADAEIVRLVTG